MAKPGTKTESKVAKAKTASKASKSSKAKTTEPTETKPIAKVPIILTNVSAAQIILANYVKPRKTFVVGDDNDTSLPQTFVTNPEDDEIPISDLLHEKSKRVSYFLDIRKVQNKYWANMIDVTNIGPLPAITNKPCRWCRSSFVTRPIGLPLVYHSNKTSGIEKERFEEKLREANLPTTTNDFFETEGIFCSFPCCKAYVLDQRGNPKYKDSLGLLGMLFGLYYGRLPDYPTAPTWKVLREYGGHLTIDEFRATFGKLVYEETVNTQRPYMYASSQYIRERRIKPFQKAEKSR